MIAIRGGGALFPEAGAALAAAGTRWCLPSPPNLDRMDRLCGLGLCAANQALLAAAELPAVPGEQVAVLFASAHGCHATDEEYYRRYLEGGEALSAASPRLFVYTLPSSPVGEVSIHYGLRGPGLAEVGGPAAGLLAVAEGLRLLRGGRARRALVLAAEVATPLLSRLRGPEGDARDGAAALVLEALSPGAAPAALGQVLAVAQRYQPGALQQAVAAAARQALGAAAGPVPVVAPPGLPLDAAGLPGPLLQDPALYPPRSGAVGALHALARLGQRGHLAALVVAADPDGNAAAAWWSAA